MLTPPHTARKAAVQPLTGAPGALVRQITTACSESRQFPTVKVQLACSLASGPLLPVIHTRQM